MKKTKIITISILGLLLLVPFMTPTVAAPASYVPVAEEETYLWELSQYNTNFAQFFADNMSDVIATIFSQPIIWQIITVYTGWSWDSITPQSSWPLTVKAILPENTSTFLLPDYFIPDNITHTPVYLGSGYNVLHYPAASTFYDDTWYIVNDTASFAKQSLFGGTATSPYMIMGVPFGPKNINWTEFVAVANGGMGGGYWTGDAVNTTVTALSDGYSLSVPISGYGSNTLPITINVSYNANSILDNYTFQYGALTLFYYELVSYEADGVNPVTTSPSDFAVAHDYTGESISWTATDANPGNYTIKRDAITVVTPTPWASGTPVTYNITDGLAEGASYTFEITFSDAYGNSVSDSVVMTVTVPDTTDPVITSAPSDLVVAHGYTGQSLSWTATDANPGTYVIKCNGTLVVVPATAWISGTPVTYNIPDGYEPSVTTYEITFSDVIGNNVSDSATLTVNPATTPPGIPGYEPLIVIGITGIASICLIIFKKKKR